MGEATFKDKVGLIDTALAEGKMPNVYSMKAIGEVTVTEAIREPIIWIASTISGSSG